MAWHYRRRRLQLRRDVGASRLSAGREAWHRERGRVGIGTHRHHVAARHSRNRTLDLNLTTHTMTQYIFNWMRACALAIVCAFGIASCDPAVGPAAVSQTPKPG